MITQIHRGIIIVYLKTKPPQEIAGVFFPRTKILFLLLVFQREISH